MIIRRNVRDSHPLRCVGCLEPVEWYAEYAVYFYAAIGFGALSTKAQDFYAESAMLVTLDADITNSCISFDCYRSHDDTA